MRLVKMIISLALVGMTAYGWLTIGSAEIASGSEYDTLVAQGDKSYHAMLYEDAYNKYTAALKLRDTKEVTEKQVDAYTLFYREEEYGDYSVRHKLLSVLDSARLSYPTSTEFAIQEIELYLEENDFSAAKKVCEQASETVQSDEKLLSLWNDIITSYTLDYVCYSEYHEAVNGYFTVTSGLAWNWLTQDGADKSSDTYLFMGPVGSDGIYLAQKEGKEVRFYDLDGVARGRTERSYSGAGMYKEGLCPAETPEGEWVYLDLDGEKVLGPYQKAGAFSNGRAAVMDENGNWYFIDKNGTKIPGSDYAEICLALDGSYECNGIILAAKEKDVYVLLDSDFKQIGNFSCDNIDVPTEYGVYAFEQDGKWGFVDSNGQIVIEPQFECAKSFCNGLAAVCRDGLWGYIGENQDLVTEYQFYSAGYVTSAGTAMISDEDGYYRMMKYNFLQELVG